MKFDNTYDPIDLAGQQRDRESKDREKRVNQIEWKRDLQWLMSDPRGRRIMWRMLDMSGTFARTFHPTAMIMAFQEGVRSIGTALFGDVMAYCPDKYQAMRSENQTNTDV